MSDLTAKFCEACEGGVDVLSANQVDNLLPQTPGWRVSEDGKEIRREFSFSNFYETMAFVNSMAWIAHREDHHPDFEVGYKRCDVRYSTHAIGGLSENDFICAAKINALLATS